MTPKELKRLSRSDLLEMLLDLSRENDRLNQENRELKARLEDRMIAIGNCSSLADAALQLNGVFQAAQAACDQYTENIRHRSENLEEYCRQMEQQTQEKCDAMLAQAKQQAQEYLNEADRSRKSQEQEYRWLTELMEGGEVQ